MEPTKRVRVQRVTELSFKCEGTMHITVRKCFDQYGGEQNVLAYTFNGAEVNIHGMLHNGSVSKKDKTNFLFFTDPTSMSADDSVEMAGAVSDSYSVAETVGDEAGSLTEDENMFEGIHLM